jgi:hypothetical protein
VQMGQFTVQYLCDDTLTRFEPGSPAAGAGMQFHGNGRDRRLRSS